MPGARKTAGRGIAFGAGAIPAAVAWLRNADFALVLATGEGEPGFLPPATEAEHASARSAADPAGHLRRRRIARALAAGFTGHEAADFAITAADLGQPKLSGPGGLHVSFAARGDLSLVGIARRPLGVDLEGAIAPDAIPWNILRLDEAEALRALPEPARAGAFLDLWTGKEATLKVLGTGLHVPPEALWLTGGGIVRQHQDPSSGQDPSSVMAWRTLPLQVSWPERHDVFHNTFHIAVALLSNGDPDPFEPGQS